MIDHYTTGALEMPKVENYIRISVKVLSFAHARESTYKLRSTAKPVNGCFTRKDYRKI